MVATDSLFELDVASLSPVFLVALVVRVAAAMTAIVSGIVAMLSRKGAGRHPRAGHVYMVAIWVVFVSACVLGAFRWPGDLPLVVVGGFGALAATYGFEFRRMHRPGDVPHVVAMALSYIAMLTAFYVDNGPPLANFGCPTAYRLLARPLNRRNSALGDCVGPATTFADVYRPRRSAAPP